MELGVIQQSNTGTVNLLASGVQFSSETYGGQISPIIHDDCSIHQTNWPIPETQSLKRPLPLLEWIFCEDF